MKVRIFIGPRDSKPLNYGNYGDLHEITKTIVLEEFKLEVENFLGYHISPNKNSWFSDDFKPTE